MTKYYKFISEDTSDKSVTMMEFNTDDETWNTPMERFFLFLKGMGFVFGMEDVIGVDTENGFREANSYDPYASYTNTCNSDCENCDK